MEKLAISLTSVDVRLLQAIEATGSVAEACRSIGCPRDRGVYRLERITRAYGRPAVEATRGGRNHGGSRLTALGVELLRTGEGRPPGLPGVELSGYWSAHPVPHVSVDGLSLEVGFSAAEGESLRILVDPESILVARTPVETSARNVLHGTVERITQAPGPHRRDLVVRVGRVDLTAALTADSVRRLKLRPGRRVVLLVKATAIHRAPATRGSPRR